MCGSGAAGGMYSVICLSLLLLVTCVCPILYIKLAQANLMPVRATKHKMHETHTLLDSGANGIFINIKWAKENKITMTKLTCSIPVFNVD